MFRVITEGFGLGLSTGAYCLGSCLPFFAPYLVSEGRPGIRDNIYSELMFLSGRLCAYVLFSVVASALGILFEPKVPPSLASAALLFTSLAMILYALVKNFPAFRICGWAERRLPARRFPFVLGFLVGINICPPFLVGLARLLEMR
ncbi:MAG: sulfite exporter TauE/SafE family protein, partial [Candidatus Omnitrophota bacterium]